VYQKVYHVQYGVVVHMNYFFLQWDNRGTCDLISTVEKKSRGTRRFASITHKTGIISRFLTITREMTHLKTIPALYIFRITGFLLSVVETRSRGIYRTIARMMTRFLAVATFLVWTISDIMTHLLTLLALNSFHIHRFLYVMR
jgi:hypothetical protein